MLTRRIRSIGALLLLLSALIFWRAPVSAQEGRGDTLAMPRVKQPPKLEDFLNGYPPDAALKVTDFRQREPGDGVPVSQPTTAYLSYDEGTLYVVFVCKDDPAKVRASIARREEISADDQVAIYLDTFLDREHAYVFATNPLGVQRDGILTEGQGEDWSFDTVWASEGQLTDSGYVVRMAIPFRSLRFRNDRTQIWRVAVGRIIPRNSEEAYWPHVTKRVQGFVPQFAAVNGLAEISSGRNAQLNPYVVATRARFLNRDAAAYETSREGRIGMDAKMVFRNAVTVDGTVNPDFSQVESDDPQVTVNERFEVFFPEKRPFFIENAGYFRTPINLLFTRRIVDPGVGTRLTGKIGRWGIGAIAVNDRAPGRLPADDPLAGRDAAVGALRAQREFGEESNVGVLVTDREFARAFSRIFAVDSRWKVAKNWAVAGQFARSANRELEGPQQSGSAALVQAAHDGRHFDYLGNFVYFSPEFAAPLGFVKRVGYRQTEHEAKYRWRLKDKALLKYGPKASVLFNWDRQGRLQDREVALNFQGEFIGNTELKFERVQTFELFEERPFNLHANVASFTTEWFKWLGLSASYAWGTAVNHDPASGVDPFIGKATEGELIFTFRPATRLRLDQAFIHSSLRTRDGSSPVFTERQLRLKLNYQFNRLLSMRAIADYASLSGDTALADLENERSWTTDFLMMYLVHPGTALYVGYTDRNENLEIVRGPFATLRRSGSSYSSVGRQIFVKLSYLWRF